MIVVQTSTSVFPAINRAITASSSSASIWPWPISTLACGQRCTIRSRTRSMLATRLCKKNTWPCRSSSRSIAARMIRSSYADTTVSTGKRLGGGVSIVDMSFTPTSER